MDLSSIAVVPLVIAIVAALKAIPAVASRTWLQPIMAIVTGVALTALLLMGWPPSPLPPAAQLVAIALLNGIVNGLAGAGLYDTGKGAIRAVGL